MGNSESFEFRNDGVDETVPPIYSLSPEEANARFTKEELAKISSTYKTLLKSSKSKDGIDYVAFSENWLSTPKNPHPMPAVLSRHLFDAMDPNGSGSIDYQEFLLSMALACRGNLEEQLDFFFHIASGHSDYISKPDLLPLLESAVDLTYSLLNRNQEVNFKLEELVDDAFDKFSTKHHKSRLYYPQYREWITQHAEIADFVQYIMERGWHTSYNPSSAPVIYDLPKPPQVEKAITLITPDELMKLQDYFPAALQGFDAHLVYSSNRDGYSLINLYNKSKSHQGAVVVLVKTAKKERFGFFVNQTLNQPTKDYIGDESCFLFQLQPSFITFTETFNTMFVRPATDSLQVGGPTAAFSIDNELDKGISKACATFDSPCLLDDGETFRCVCVEVIGFHKPAEVEQAATQSQQQPQQQQQDARSSNSGARGSKDSNPRASGVINARASAVTMNENNKEPRRSMVARASQVYKRSESVAEIAAKNKELEAELKRLRAALKDARKSTDMHNFNS